MTAATRIAILVPDFSTEYGFSASVHHRNLILGAVRNAALRRLALRSEMAKLYANQSAA
jgi:hypothetical protein